MDTEMLSKEFIKTTQVLPLSIYGLTSVEDFRNAEENLGHQEWLKRAGLTQEEVVLYLQDEAGLLGRRDKIETSVLKSKLETIHDKIKHFENSSDSLENDNSSTQETKNPTHNSEIPIKFYPEGHPIHELKQLDEILFGHLKVKLLPITKRRKILRRLERKKERSLQQIREAPIDLNPVQTVNKPNSLWDVKDNPSCLKEPSVSTVHNRDRRESNLRAKDTFIGPKKPMVYTIKNNKIVRLEPVDSQSEEFRAIDIVLPVNTAEEKLLEGTKMSLEDIMKMERFKDYKPGTPSKVLYLKNIASAVTQEQLSSLFKQFTMENGGTVDVRLMSGRMRGQAFVSFKDDNLAARALDSVNGTILSGRPIIVQFGKNSNRIQMDNNR